MSDKIPSMSINVKGRPINPDIIDALALELKAVAQGLRDGTCILSENSGFCLTVNDEETSLFASMSFPKVKAPAGPAECPLGYGHGGQWCGPGTNCWLDPRPKGERT